MKRESLITKLVAFMLCVMMVVGCLPVSAFAAENDWEGDIDVVETEPPVGSESNPIDLTNEWAWNEAHTEATVTVTVPAGKTIYYQSYNVAGMTMTIGDGDPIVCSGNPRTPYVWSIPNNGETEADYVITIAYPVGSMENPYAASLYENVVSVEAGDKDGYYMTYTAEYTGTLVVTISTEAAGWSYVINNNTAYIYGDTQWSDSDPVVNPAEIAVTEGDEIQIIVNTYDPADSWNSPAGEINAYLEYKPGSCEAFPIFLGEQVNNVTNAGTMYYKGYFAGMNVVITGEGEFTVISDGEEIAAVDGKVEVSYPTVMGRPMPNSIVIVGDGEFTIAASYPLGTMENPAVAVLGDNTASIAAGGSEYVWNYTAEKDGDLVITVSTASGNWQYVVNNMTTYVYGDTQWSDSDPVVNPATITVKAGDVIEIKALTYDPESPWAAPAGDVIVNLAYAVTECEHEYEHNITPSTKDAEGLDIRTCTICGDVQEVVLPAGLAFATANMSLESSIAVRFHVNPVAFAEGAYTDLRVEYCLGDTIVEENIVDVVDFTINASNNRRMYTFAGICPYQMDETIHATLYGTYEGYEYSFYMTYSAKTYVLNQLRNSRNASNTKLLTLLVDLMNYGSAHQIYAASFGRYTYDVLLNSYLTEEEKAYATTELPTFNNGLNQTYATIDNPTAVFKGASLTLDSAVVIRYSVVLPENKDGIVLKLTDETGKAYEDIPFEEFELQSNGRYNIYFDQMLACRMRLPVYATIYQNGVAISDTLQYSIETYAYRNYAGSSEILQNLLNAMHIYGDSAYNYFIA